MDKTKSGRYPGAGSVAENRRVRSIIKKFVAEGHFERGETAVEMCEAWNLRCEKLGKPEMKRGRAVFTSVLTEIRAKAFEQIEEDAVSHYAIAARHLLDATTVDKMNLIQKFERGEAQDLDAHELAGVGVKFGKDGVTLTFEDVSAARTLLTTTGSADKAAAKDAIEILAQLGDAAGLAQFQTDNPFRVFVSRMRHHLAEAGKL